MDRRSSLLGVFVRVKTHIGLERFEVGKLWWKNFDFAPGPEGCAIKNCFGTIEGLAIGFNCVEGFLLNQNFMGIQLFIVHFWLIFSSTGPGDNLDKKLLQVQVKAYS